MTNNADDVVLACEWDDGAKYKIVLTIPPLQNIKDMMEYFKVILCALGYHQDAVDSYFKGGHY